LSLAIRSWHLSARTVAQPERADIILALRSRAEDPRLQSLLQVSGRPLHLVRKNTTAQIRQMLQQVVILVNDPQDAEVSAAVV